jgi:hypothetical protein
LPRRPLTSKEEGREILELLYSLLENLWPERYGSSEPLRKKFDPHNLDEILASWDEPFCLFCGSRRNRAWREACGYASARARI